MTSIELALLWLAWVVAGGSPGPATMAIAGTAMAHGRRAGLAVSFGILAGSASWGIAAALGLTALMLTYVWVLEAMRYLGAAYLLFLAYKAAKSAIANSGTAGGTVFNGSMSQTFAKGALLHITNPKAIFGWGSIFAIILPAGAAFADLVWMFCFLFSGSIFIFISYAFLFSSPAVVRVYTRARPLFEVVFAALFGFAAVKILTARLQ
jgi:threonine efflux protein